MVSYLTTVNHFLKSLAGQTCSGEDAGEAKEKVREKIGKAISIIEKLLEKYPDAKIDIDIHRKLQVLKRLKRFPTCISKPDLERVRKEAIAAYDYIRQRLIMRSRTASKDKKEDVLDERADAFGLGANLQGSLEEQLENIQWLKRVGSPRAREILKEVATEYGPFVKDLEEEVLFAAAAALCYSSSVEPEFLLEFIEDHLDSLHNEKVAHNFKWILERIYGTALRKREYHERVIALCKELKEKGAEIHFVRDFVFDVATSFRKWGIHTFRNPKKEANSEEKAIGFFEQAIDLVPDYARPYFNLAQVYFKLKKYDEAIKYSLQGFKLFEWNRDQTPSGARKITLLGKAYYQKGEYKKAIETFDKTLSLFHYQNYEIDFAEAYYYLSLAKDKLKRKDALEDYKKACEFDPKYKERPAPKTKPPEAAPAKPEPAKPEEPLAVAPIVGKPLPFMEYSKSIQEEVKAFLKEEYKNEKMKMQNKLIALGNFIKFTQENQELFKDFFKFKHTHDVIQSVIYILKDDNLSSILKSSKAQELLRFYPKAYKRIKKIFENKIKGIEEPSPEQKTFNRTKEILGENHWKDLGSPRDYSHLVALLKECKYKVDEKKLKSVIEAARKYKEDYFIYEEKKELTLNSSDKHYYVNLNWTAGENQLYALLEASKLEEAWVYIEYELDGKKYKRFFECGLDETKKGATMNYHIIPKLMRKGAKISRVILPHIHPPASSTPVPTRKDIVAFSRTAVNLRRNYKYSGKLEFRVITYMGQYVLTPDLGAEKYFNKMAKVVALAHRRSSMGSLIIPDEIVKEFGGKKRGSDALKASFEERVSKIPPFNYIRASDNSLWRSRVRVFGKRRLVEFGIWNVKIKKWYSLEKELTKGANFPLPLSSEETGTRNYLLGIKGDGNFRKIFPKEKGKRFSGDVESISEEDQKRLKEPGPLFIKEKGSAGPLKLDLEKAYSHPDGTPYSDKELELASSPHRISKVLADTKKYEEAENARKRKILGSAAERIEKHALKKLQEMGIHGNGVIVLKAEIHQRTRKNQEHIQQKEDGSLTRPKHLGKVLFKYKGLFGEENAEINAKVIKLKIDFEKKLNGLPLLSIGKKLLSLTDEALASLYFETLKPVIGKPVHTNSRPTYMISPSPATYLIKIKVSGEKLEIIHE